MIRRESGSPLAGVYYAALFAAVLALLGFSGVQAQVVVPVLGSHGDVPSEVVSRFTSELRRQLAGVSELRILPGELVTAGIAGSLEPELAYLIAELGEGRYGISGEVRRVNDNPNGDRYTVNLLVGDARDRHTSDLLSQSFSAANPTPAAAALAREVARFADVEAGLERGSATLFVSSQPGEAQVYLNGVWVGETSYLEPLALEPGRYDIEWRKDGFLPHTDSVTLGPNQTELLSARLTPTRGGGIQVRSKPASSVFINGDFVGETPITIPAPAGEQRVRLERPGFESTSLLVRVRDFRTSRIDETLRATSATLIFWEPPEGYLVYVNGLLRPRSFVADLEPGTHEVEMRSSRETISFRVRFLLSGVYRLDLTERRLLPF